MHVYSKNLFFSVRYILYKNVHSMKIEEGCMYLPCTESVATISRQNNCITKILKVCERAPVSPVYRDRDRDEQATRFIGATIYEADTQSKHCSRSHPDVRCHPNRHGSRKKANFFQTLGLHGAFWFYAAVAVCGLCFVVCCVPETKGKQLDEMNPDYAQAR